MLGQRRHLLVAYSGGLDSTVLLHLLVQLRAQVSEHYPPTILNIRAVHIHHSLSTHADEWACHCQQQCEHWQVPFSVVRVEVANGPMGIEAAARQARYRALQQQQRPGEDLLTAQHLDDQCETFLLALKRGSGPAGLSAMAAIMPFGSGELLRPLLGCSRRQLEDYARQQQLNWIEDESNQDHRFDRNFLRHAILPALTQRWPYFAQTTARSAALCAEQEQLLDELLQPCLAALLDERGSLAIAGLGLMSEVKRQALLRRWMAAAGFTLPSRDHLQRIWHEVALSRSDAEPQLQLAEGQIRRFRQRLYLLPPMVSLKGVILPWQPATILVLPDNLGQLMLADEGVSLRPAEDGEKVSVRFGVTEAKVNIIGRQHSRTLKKLWQELAIPPWQRERIPMLYYNEHLIAALGVFVTVAGQVEKGKAAWQVVWQRSDGTTLSCLSSHTR